MEGCVIKGSTHFLYFFIKNIPLEMNEQDKEMHRLKLHCLF